MINQKPKDQFLNPDQFDNIDFEDEDDEIELDQSELENLANFHQEQDNQVPNVLDNSFVNQDSVSESIDQPEDVKPTKAKRQRKTLVQPIAFFEGQGSNKRFHLVLDYINHVAPVLIKATAIKINQMGSQNFMKVLCAAVAKAIVDGIAGYDYLETSNATSNSKLLIDIQALLEEQNKKMTSLYLNQQQFYESKLVNQALKENEDQ